MMDSCSCVTCPRSRGEWWGWGATIDQAASNKDENRTLPLWWKLHIGKIWLKRDRWVVQACAFCVLTNQRRVYNRPVACSAKFAAFQHHSAPHQLLLPLDNSKQKAAWAESSRPGKQKARGIITRQVIRGGQELLWTKSQFFLARNCTEPARRNLCAQVAVTVVLH